MSCNSLTGGLNTLRWRAMMEPAFRMLTVCERPGGWMEWLLINGGYLLYRGASTIDYTYPVGIASRGSLITEQFAGRPVTDGNLTYAIRGVGPLGVEDTASPPQSATVALAAGVVQPPSPPPPTMWRVEPAFNGQILVVAQISNVGAQAPATSLSVYTDGATGGGVDWNTPLGAAEPVSGAGGTYSLTRDPALLHGAVVEVGVRTKAANGEESQNTDTQTVTLDKQGPPPLANFTVEAIC